MPLTRVIHLSVPDLNFLKKKKNDVGVLPVSMSVHCVFGVSGGQMQALDSQELELDSCDLSCGYLDLNRGPSEGIASALK